MSENDFARVPVADRNEYTARVERAKKISSALLGFMNSPAALILSADHRAVLADVSALLIELARYSHAKFDMHPYDLPELVRRVESLERKVNGEN